MSLPYFPSTSGLKPSELHVYTIEECQSCKQKTKRDFKVGDYIVGAAGTCEKCQGQKMIVLVYGEKVSQPERKSILRTLFPEQRPRALFAEESRLVHSAELLSRVSLEVVQVGVATAVGRAEATSDDPAAR